MPPFSVGVLVPTISDETRARGVVDLISRNNAVAQHMAACERAIERVSSAMPLRVSPEAMFDLGDEPYTPEERVEAAKTLDLMKRVVDAKRDLNHFNAETLLEQARALYAEAAAVPYEPRSALVARELRKRAAEGRGTRSMPPQQLKLHIQQLQHDMDMIEWMLNIMRAGASRPKVMYNAASERPSHNDVALLAPLALGAAGILATVALRFFASGRVGRLLAAQGAEPLPSPLVVSCVGARVVLLPDAPRHTGLYARRGQLGTVVAVNAGDTTADVRWDRGGGGAVARAVPAAALLRVARKRALEPPDCAPGVRVCLRAGAGGVEAATRHGTLVGPPPLVALPLKLINAFMQLLGPLGAALRGGRDDDVVVRVRWDRPLRAAAERISSRELAWCGFELCGQQHAEGIVPPGDA